MFKFLNFIFIIPIKLYQILLSPLLGQSCRYHPTCSQYAVEAIEKYGPIKGIWLGIKRIARCHPWGGSGHDPGCASPKQHYQSRDRLKYAIAASRMGHHQL